MARKAKTPTPVPLAELDAFDRQVELALEHIDDREYLGRYSPLAQPYLLGRMLAPNGSDRPASGTGMGASAGDLPSVRGEALRRLLRHCATKLDTEEQKLLEISYFARSSSLENIELANRMNVAERTFYRIRVRAIKSLAQVLHEATAPVLRAEAPGAQAAGKLVGREEVSAAMLAGLRRGRSLYLSGPTGVGKSALAAAVLERWQAASGAGNHAAGGEGCWYTLRSHINDHAVSMVFAVAHRLRALGEGHTWRQLVADRGVTDWERTFALLRFDLGALPRRALLFCIDDMDVLQDDVADHMQIVHVLEELKQHCPVVFIGQRMVLAADEYVTLQGLEAKAAETLLATQGVILPSPALLAELVRHTRGHPAILLLYAALVRAGEEPQAALDVLARSPTFEALFHRIWRRLSSEERALLQQLAVFRTPAPQDAWPELAEVAERLQLRGVATLGSNGGIQVEPHLLRVVQGQIAPEERPLLHLRAAAIREEHGDFVAAMHHAVEGRQPARAVWLWFRRRDVEIERGQGPAALETLRRIALTELGNVQDRRALLVARSELYKLAGAADAAADELAAAENQGARNGRSAMNAYVHVLKGQICEMQGQAEQALEAYRAAIDLYAGLPQPRAILAHLQQSFVYLYRMHNIGQAKRAAILARARADAFLGDLEIMAGRYAAAIAYLDTARTSAEAVGDDLAVLSRIYSYLGALHGRLGEVERALAYIEMAMECDRRRGDAVGPLYDEMNRVAALWVAERYEESLAKAREGLAAAERLKNTYLVCGLAAGAAEALCRLQRWEEAEQYAVISLRQEEEFFRGPACVVLALVRQAQDRKQEAEALLREAMENARAIGDRYVEASAWCARAQIAAGPGEAKAAWRQALEIYQDLGIEYEVRRVQGRLAETH